MPPLGVTRVVTERIAEPEPEGRRCYRCGKDGALAISNNYVCVTLFRCVGLVTILFICLLAFGPVDVRETWCRSLRSRGSIRHSYRLGQIHWHGTVW